MAPTRNGLWKFVFALLILYGLAAPNQSATTSAIFDDAEVLSSAEEAALLSELQSLVRNRTTLTSLACDPSVRPARGGTTGHRMRPILFEIFGVGVPSFGAMFALAVVVGIWLTLDRIEEKGGDAAKALTVLMLAVGAGYVGARLWWVVEAFSRGNASGVGYDPGTGETEIVLAGVGRVRDVVPLPSGKVLNSVDAGSPSPRDRGRIIQLSPGEDLP